MKRNHPIIHPGYLAGGKECRYMFKVRLAVLGALALFIVSGISASAASASGPFWHVNGAKLSTGARQIKLQSKGPLFLKQAATLEIECKNSISEGATIEGNQEKQGQGKGRTLYSSCTVPFPTGEVCEVGNEVSNRGQIKTNQIKAYLANAGQTGDVEVFEPTQGGVFATFLLENAPGKKCTLKGEVGVAGGAVAEVQPVGVNGQEGLISFPSTAIKVVKHEGVETIVPSLKTVGIVGTFSGVYAARLATFPETFGVFET
jgi:hypothetical protein